MQVNSGRITERVDGRWKTVDFFPDFNERPVTVANVQTFDERDSVSPRLQNVDYSTFEVQIDDVGGYASELVYLASEEGYIRDTHGDIVGEAGTKWVDQSSPDTWETCNFKGNYEDPVAFAQIMTFKGSQPCHTRLRSVESGSLDVKIEEWETQDEVHYEELVGYVIFDAHEGAIVLDNGMLVEVGTREMDDDTWSSVTLSRRWGQDAKVISHCQTYRDGDPVVTRQKAPPNWVRNYPKDPPEVALRLQGVGSYPEHGSEEVGYLAVGNALETDAVITEETVDEQWTGIDFNRAFAESPVTIASIQTFNGSDAATIRFNKWGPYGIRARIDEPYGSSSQPIHSNEEAVGCVALKRGAITDTDGADIGFAGTSSIRLPEQGSISIPIDASNLENPVAFAQVLTFKGPQSCHTRLDWDGGRSKVEVTIEEWEGEGYDDHHFREDIGYVVLEAGTHQLDDGTLVHVDTLETDRSWAEATYPEAIADYPAWEDPPIITRCQTKRGEDPVVTRQSRSLDSNDHSFSVRLQEEAARHSGGDSEPSHEVERIGYLVAGSPLRLDAGRAAETVDDTWTSVKLTGGFGQKPVVLADMQTYNGPDPAGIRIQHRSQTDFKAMVQEEDSDGSGVEHGNPEALGYFAVDRGQLLDTKGDVVGEANLVDVVQDSRWDEVGYPLHVDYTTPVAFAQLETYQDEEPAHVRLNDVGRYDGIDISIEEWEYLQDRSHPNETVGYVVFEAGTHQLDDGTFVEVGTVETDESWEPVSIGSDIGPDPTVITQIQTENDRTPVVTRNRDVSASGFEVRLQEEAANDGDHGVETVGYLVIG